MGGGGRECAHAWESAPSFGCEACALRTLRYARVVARRRARQDLVEDVASVATAEIFLLRKFDPAKGPFPSFVWMIVGRTAAQFHRVERRERRNLDAAGAVAVNVVRRGGVPYAEGSGPEQAIRTSELSLMMWEVTRKLSPENRRAFAMHLLGYKRWEIAEAVLVDGAHISPQAWGQRLRPIEAHVAKALELRLERPPAER